MPASYVIDRKRRIVFVRSWGTLTDEEMFAQQRRLRADPAFGAGFRRLVDLSQVEQFQITADGIREVVARDHCSHGARRAFVSPTDIGFGIARMHEILLDESPHEIAVFRTASEARHWLGMDDSDPGPNAD